VQTIQGTTITFPTTPTTPSPTTTTVTTLGGSTTTSTTTPGGIATRFVPGKALSLKYNAKTTKRRGTLVLTVDDAATTGLDPTPGAEVRLRGLQTGVHDTWVLPAGGWKATKKGSTYADKTQANGPVTAAVMAKGRVVVKAKGAAIAYPLLGTGPQGAIAVGMVFPGGGDGALRRAPRRRNDREEGRSRQGRLRGDEGPGAYRLPRALIRGGRRRILRGDPCASRAHVPPSPPPKERLDLTGYRPGALRPH